MPALMLFLIIPSREVGWEALGPPGPVLSSPGESPLTATCIDLRIPSWRAQIAPAPPASGALPGPPSAWLRVHRHEHPPGVAAAPQLLCPQVLDAAGRAEGVGLGSASTGVGAELSLVLPAPASGSPRETDLRAGDGGWLGCGAPPGRADLRAPSPLDHLGSASAPSGDPPRRGARVAVPGLGARSRAFCRRRGWADQRGAAPARGAAPLAAGELSRSPRGLAQTPGTAAAFQPRTAAAPGPAGAALRPAKPRALPEGKPELGASSLPGDEFGAPGTRAAPRDQLTSPRRCGSARGRAPSPAQPSPGCAGPRRPPRAPPRAPPPPPRGADSEPPARPPAARGCSAPGRGFSPGWRPWPSTMGCFCAVPEEFYCEVLLLDESKLTLTTQQQGIKKSTKGSIVLDHVFRHINLVEIDYFGLRYCDRSHQTFWLDPAKTLSEHKELINTGPPYTLYFGIKFYAEDPCKLKEEITRYQFFLQVKQDVLQGRLPCPVNIAAQLGAYAIQSELGDYDPYKHTAGYVSEYRFVPDQKEELEEAIERIHKTLMGQTPSEAELNYLRTSKSLEMYGVDLHPVYGENKSEYFLGLTPVGVVVYKNKKQVGKYFWPRITKVHFKETQFELRVLGKDLQPHGTRLINSHAQLLKEEKEKVEMYEMCNETSFFFEARSKTACKHLWKCSVEHHTFFRMPETESNSLSRKLSKFGSIGNKHRYSGRTALQMSRDISIQLPRPDQNVARSRSKTYPKRVAQTQPAGSNSINQITADMENGENEGTTKIIAPSPVKSFKKAKNENSPETQRSKPRAPWEENGPQSGLYNSPSDRTKSPKFPCTRRRNPSCGSDDSVQPMRRRKAHNSGEDSDLKQRRRSRSRCNTSSGSESENSNREHRKKRNRIRQENDMVDSAPQWEAVLRRQKEKNQTDPNNRRSRHRSRSRSPDIQAKEELWKHIQKELVDPSGMSEEQLKEIPYTKIETQGDPVRIRHSHSPRSYRQYRRSQCSDGERSVLSEVNSKTDLVPPLPVTRSSDAQGSGGSTVHQRRNGSKDSLIEDKSQISTSSLAGKHTAKTVKTIQAARLKIET